MDGLSRMIQPRHVVADTSRHGKVRWYFRKQGQPKIRLPDSGPGTEAFAQAYRDAFNGSAPTYKQPKGLRHKPPRIQSGYVYFLRAGDTIKIGFSQKPFARWSELSTGISGRMTAFVAVTGTTLDERILHKRFADFRLRGEWFEASEPVLEAMGKAASQGIRASHRSPTLDGGGESHQKYENNISMLEA
jgi:hypothetical protein